jgi:hypothetical protein
LAWQLCRSVNGSGKDPAYSPSFGI